MTGSAAFWKKIKALRVAQKLSDAGSALRCKTIAGGFSTGDDKIKVVTVFSDCDADKTTLISLRLTYTGSC